MPKAADVIKATKHGDVPLWRRRRIFLVTEERIAGLDAELTVLTSAVCRDSREDRRAHTRRKLRCRAGGGATARAAPAAGGIAPESAGGRTAAGSAAATLRSRGGWSRHPDGPGVEASRYWRHPASQPHEPEGAEDEDRGDQARAG